MQSEEFKDLKSKLDLADLGLDENDFKIPKFEETYGNGVDVSNNDSEKVAENDGVELPALTAGKDNMPMYHTSETMERRLSESISSFVKPDIRPDTKPSIDRPEIQKPLSPKQDSQPKNPAVSPVLEKFKKEEKESVIASFVTQEKFVKTFKLNNLFSVQLKTISDEEQHMLNETLQTIELMGDKRKHAYFYGSGAGEEFDTYYHVDALRKRRLTIMSYHLDSISTQRIPSGDDGRKVAMGVISKLPTNLINAIYSKCVVPFLELVEEACRDIEVF